MCRLFVLGGVNVMNAYKTVGKEAHDYFIEKKSKFIGYAKPVLNEQEALDFIQSKRSKHWDATHNVYAYILRDKTIQRYSDDGEPQGTAGIPTLDVLKKNNITDVVVVVTRYFGGVMLGAGGLVRAYSHGAKIALDAAGIIEMKPSFLCKICCSYNQYGRISSLIPEHSGVIDSTDFTDVVLINFHISKEYFNAFEKELTNVTCGEVNVKKDGEKYFSAE